MKNIYILDEYQSSMRNGIGTYLQELLVCLEKLDATVWLIEFNSPELFFCIKTNKKIKEIHFPIFQQNRFSANYKIIDKFFRLYIEDSPNNWFMFNHSPCENLLNVVKQSFPLSKITFTIHDWGWTSRLFGDYHLLKEIVSKKEHRKIQHKYQHVLDYFDEEQRMYAIVDQVICLSEDAYQCLIDIYNVNKEKIHLIHNGLRDFFQRENSKETWRKKLLFSDNKEKIILFAGRTTKLKGIDSLLKSFSQVVKNYPQCRLVVIGHLSDSDVVLNLSKSIASKITYTGLTDKEELRNWYRIADVGILPSICEQCSYTGIEMMMHGLAIVASDGFGVKAMFREGLNARIAKIGNRKNPQEYSDNLAEAITEVLHSSRLQKQLCKVARKEYMSRYTLDKMQRGYEHLFHSLFDDES
jgi:glycosyltransferase